MRSAIRTRAISVTFAVSTVLSGAICQAQAALKAPNGMPDVVGLYPGMPVSDAYNLLKAYFPNRGGRVDLVQEQWPGVNGDKPLPTVLHIPAIDQQGAYDDVIDVAVTLPPTKQAVWAVKRSVRFEPGKAPSTNAVIAGLRQKYGPEMPSQSRGAVTTLRWYFDANGKRAPDSLAGCAQTKYDPVNRAFRQLVYDPSPNIYGNLLVAPAGLPGGEACKTFTYLEVDVNDGLTGVAAGLTVTMYDLGLAITSGAQTQAMVHGLANAEQKAADQRQQTVDKSAVPKF
jgi:hypothetical protein